MDSMSFIKYVETRTVLDFFRPFYLRSYLEAETKSSHPTHPAQTFIHNILVYVSGCIWLNIKVSMAATPTHKALSFLIYSYSFWALRSNRNYHLGSKVWVGECPVICLIYVNYICLAWIVLDDEYANWVRQFCPQGTRESVVRRQ